MPTYTFRCAMGHTFDRMLRMEERDRPVSCPICGTDDTLRIVSSPAIVMDWKLSESVHSSKRFRPSAENRATSEVVT